MFASERGRLSFATHNREVTSDLFLSAADTRSDNLRAAAGSPGVAWSGRRCGTSSRPGDPVRLLRPPARPPVVEGKPGGLDFGGKFGRFPVDAGDNVADEDYGCLDLNRSVVEQGDEPFRQCAVCLAAPPLAGSSEINRNAASGNRQFGRYR